MPFLYLYSIADLIMVERKIGKTLLDAAAGVGNCSILDDGWIILGWVDTVVALASTPTDPINSSCLPLTIGA